MTQHKDEGRTTLFDDCRQAKNFAQQFCDADPEVLRRELKALHRSCPGTVTLVSKGIAATCTCECHAAAAPVSGEAGSVSEVRAIEPPTCKVCGAELVPSGWKCLAHSEPGGEAEELARRAWKIAVRDYIGEEGASEIDSLDQVAIDEVAALLRPRLERAERLSELLCPVHASLDKNNLLEPFDNCIACIRVQRDELIELLKRISTDIAQTIIEDPIRAADGWAMLSQPVIFDIQAAIEPYTNAAAVLPSAPDTEKKA